MPAVAWINIAAECGSPAAASDRFSILTTAIPARIIIRSGCDCFRRESRRPSHDCEPRETSGEPPPPLPFDECFPIVDCDPTQASAVARGRIGKHFIIQGPPGTGKSQTITNLIADYVAAGKRVLFVCEKRAAIDVVYHRLRQCGLHELCCLIHDAHEDKKEFIADLKSTYESFHGTARNCLARRNGQPISTNEADPEDGEARRDGRPVCQRPE
jgi:hypothetical protein